MRLLLASYLLGSLGLLCSCTTPNPDFQGGEGTTSRADGIMVFPVLDAVAPTPEAPVPPPPKKDASPAKPDSGAPFGKICTGDASCSAGEQCIFVGDNTQEGICLRKCEKLDAPCSVPDPKFHSGCAIYYNASVKVKVCAIFCQFPDGKTFPCPNETDYHCKVFKDGLGMCAPK